MSTLKGLLFGVLFLSASASTAPPAPVPPRIIPTGQVLEELAATQNFDRSVAEYVTLHRLLERGVPPLRVTTDVREIQQAVRALALRIQVARVTARQGDLITPEVARLFRRQIATCLTPAEWQAIFDDRFRDEEGEPVEPPPLSVNMAWPEQVPFEFVPPELIKSLPALPQELQYRIIGRSLVLWDHHANLIVDFLPGAFVMTT